MLSGLFPHRRDRQVSSSEKQIGGFLLLVVAGLVALFLIAGRGDGPAGLPEPEPAAAPLEVLPMTSPNGWPRGPIETYDADHLFEKINGKDESYFAYDFVRLDFASYADPTDPERFVDVYLYDMGKPIHAFGIYRAERSGNEEPLPVGAEGCAVGGAVFARKGAVYLQALGSGPEVNGEARAIAVAAEAAIPAGDLPASEPDWFPAQGRGRIRYFLRQGLSVVSMRNVFVATYEDGSTAFVALLPDAEAAAKVGDDVVETYDFLGTDVVVEVRGRALAGVVGAPDEARAKALLAAVLERLGDER